MSGTKRANRKELFPFSSQKRTSSKKKQNKSRVWHNMCQSCGRACPSMMCVLTAQGYTAEQCYGRKVIEKTVIIEKTVESPGVTELL